MPGVDAAAFVRASVARAWPYEATVRLHAPADAPEVDTWVTSHVRIEPLDNRSCLFHLAGDAVHSVAFLLGALEIDFDVVDAPELVAELARIADRFRRAEP